MAINYFSDQLAFSVSRFSSYSKGKEYFDNGYIEKIWKDEESYKAIVKGTNSYNISLKFEGEELIYSCSCPFELDGACKHVVASILAFASNKEFTKQSMEKSKDEDESIVKELLLNITTLQQKIFLEKILRKDIRLVEDMKVFLQGQKQTPITITDYKIQFLNKLDQLDLKELLQMWYEEGMDYYDQYSDFSTESLEDLVDELITPGKSYEENENYGEALKIYQAIFEALFEKEQTLKGNISDLSDWFGQQMDKVIEYYVKGMLKINNDNLKKIGIHFLCNVFQYESIYISKVEVLLGLKQTITSKDEAKYALECLSFMTKTNLSKEESSLLAFLYFLIEDWLLF